MLWLRSLGCSEKIARRQHQPDHNEVGEQEEGDAQKDTPSSFTRSRATLCNIYDL
jgi:hypothetical protein